MSVFVMLRDVRFAYLTGFELFAFLLCCETYQRDDIERAVGKLDVLGSGYQIVDVGNNNKVVRSVPVELNVDHTRALAACAETGYTTASALQRLTNWTAERSNNTLRFLLENEIAWLDMQTPEPTYWILGLIAGSSAQK